MKKIKSLSILIIAAMLLALICPITSNAATTIQFEDSELAGQVQKFLGDKATISGSTVTITDESVLANTSTQLDVVLSNCKSLKGLETFMQKASKVEGIRFQLNAENFNLDLSPLKSATNLKHLTISGSNKTTTLNISGLSGLTKVETLVMSHVSVDQKVVEEISNMKGLKSSTGSVWNSKKVFINYSSNIICTTSETADSNGNVKISLPRYLVDPIRYHKDHKDIFTTDNGISCEVVPTDKATLTIVDDDKNPSVTVTAPLKELQSGNVKIKIAGLGSIASLTDRPISDSTISFKYVKTALKVDVKKDPTTKDAEKVKVTITANKELDPDKIPNGWTLGKDGKTLTKDFDKNGKEDVKVVAKDGDEITVNVAVDNIKEADDKKDDFKVISKTDEDQGNDKVKVTVTTNKELDPDKLPNGWTLGDDKKSVWKIMDKGATEEITLVAKDGSTLTYNVLAGGDKTQAPTKIPQTGVKNTVIAVVAVIAIGGAVFFVKSRKMLK